VLGYAELLGMSGRLSERQFELVERIDKAGKQMQTLIQNLLDLARIDLGIELAPEMFDLSQLVEEVAEEFRAQAVAKGQTLIAPSEVRTPGLIVTADPSRLRQVLRNLMSNAIKYTPSGGQITISIEALEDHFKIYVQDTGLGIPAADLPFIFGRFYRGQRDDQRDIEGNGLGLAIVKSIVEQHGGRIEVESTLGQGSRFGITLPRIRLKPEA